MATRSYARAQFLGVALASAATSSAQMRLSFFIGGMATQRGVRVPACAFHGRAQPVAGRPAGVRQLAPSRVPPFVRSLNKVLIVAEALAESRPPP